MRQGEADLYQLGAARHYDRLGRLVAVDSGPPPACYWVWHELGKCGVPEHADAPPGPETEGRISPHSAGPDPTVRA